MYSHELQTCDWPRNVGCGASENSDSGTVSTIRVTDPRTRAPQHSRAPVSQQQNTAAPQIARNANRQEYIRQRQPEVIQQQLYTEEDLGPAEEIESDRQQRVYRGQPSTIGQVQRDRDGLRTIKSGVHSQNVIPTGPDTQEKISVVSYSNQRQPRPQDQYRVDQVQGFQVTSSLPPLTPTPRTIERYNTSQRYQPNQYDQYYTVYDEDADLYRGNDYPQQEYNTPSSTPSSNIVHQYRGQTTFKQQQQAIELEQQREPIQQRHQQPLRNSYNQDVYSPPPVVQDYNDQYSSQIDDQQYQHLVASTPKAPNRQPSYTIGSTGNEVTVNRGTPPSTNRGTRPTLKPSTAIVSKASEFIDIYRYPPRRPANLYATPTPDKSAAKCRKDVCLLPDCSCGGKDIPGGYSAEEIPQLVLLTFDDSVNDLNKGLYSELFERGRVNPNGCPISATFYVSHEWTDYSQVQNLYANGHEIASHSITHSFGEQFSQKKWTKEIAGQREILAAYGGVRLEDIRGMRAPFLAVGGNKMFKMLYDSNFTYDSSMPIYENRPPSWPYTLDYKLFHDCMIPPCPTKSYPGVWEVPMVMWQDLNGGRCSMGDACSNPPTADGVYKMLIKNFERHFTTNRAPFGLYYHAAWFTHEHHKEGFIAFLDTIVNMPEVWLVTTWQAIEWVRDPQPLSTVENFPPFQCNIEKAKKCNNPKVCNLWHKSGVRYMRTCQPCPDVYPWTGKTGVKNSRVDNEIIEE
ncbi:UNVERIFIED_CONTAM: hypothetical protein PYX00_010393 [Menopon gallinae]|uniref:NodB homology domain-containing protein n=1 Tax=Menopon gallinae TaxID=328185 RepID=A0AAW2HF57_9NEOP